MQVRMIQFTQEQARIVAQVSQGDLRAWRKVVPYLAAKQGKAARFTFTDLLALAITRELTGAFGARIGSIGQGVDALFRALAEARAAGLDGMAVLVGKNSAHVLSSGEVATRPSAEAAFVVPCDVVLRQVARRIGPVEPGTSQGALPFSPTLLKTGR